MDENEIGSIIVDRSIKVHMSVGPGLLERVYEAIIAFELSRAGLDVQRQVPIPINYGTLSFNEGFRADLIVEGKVIIELKCVEKITYAHRKQVLTYLRLSRMKLGFILNFSAAFMKDGLHRMVNGLEI